MKKIDPSFLIVLLTIVVNMMGVGIAWPVLPSLIAELTGDSITNTTILYGTAATLFSITQFVCAPLLGALSDRHGRRNIMLISLLGLTFDTLVIAFANNIWWVFIGRALGGVFAATNSIASAYVTDTMSKEDRATGFGMLGAAFGIGFIFGPVLGGILGDIDIRLPFFTAAALSGLNMIFAWVFLKETLPEEKRDLEKPLDTNPFSPLKILLSNPVLVTISVVYLIFYTIQRGMENLWIIYTEYTYDWNSTQIGFSLALVGASYFIVQGFLVRPTVKKFGEEKIVTSGIMLCGLTFLLLAFPPSPAIALLGIPFYALGAGCAGPALQTIASRFVKLEHQGQLQGSLTALGGLAAIFGPVMANSSFALFTSSAAPFDFPGIFFFLGSLLFVAMSIYTSRFFRKNQHSGG